MDLTDIINLQKERMAVYGETHSDIVDNTVLRDFEDNPAYRKMTFNSEPIGVHIVESKVSTSDNTKFKYIIPKPPIKLGIGDIIKDWEDVYWLCLVNDDFHYNKVLARPCNNVLTWQDKDTLEIHELPCILTDKTSVYSDGLEKGPKLMLANDQVMTVVPSGDAVNKIMDGVRIMFDHDKRLIYETTKIDILTEKGLTKITMKHDTYKPEYDNPELNIADYVKPDNNDSNDKPTDPSVKECTIHGKDRVNMLENPVYKVVDSDGNLVADIDFSFELSNSLAIIKSQDGNTCELGINQKFRYGDVVLTAKTDGVDSIHTMSKQIRVVSI